MKTKTVKTIAVIASLWGVAAALSAVYVKRAIGKMNLGPKSETPPPGGYPTYGTQS